MKKWNKKVHKWLKDSKNLRSFLLAALAVWYVFAGDVNVLDEVLNSDIFIFIPVFVFGM